MKLMEDNSNAAEDFDLMLDQTLAERGQATPPQGYEHRLEAHLQNASEWLPVQHQDLTPTTPSSRPEAQSAAAERSAAWAATDSGAPPSASAQLGRNAADPAPILFATAGGIKAPRSAASLWTAVGFHAAAIALIAVLIARHVQIAAPVPPQVATIVAPVNVPPPPAPVMPRAEKMGGGGGQHDIAPVTKGHLPKLAQEQIVPPKAPPTIAPKLAVEPTVVVQKDLKLADNNMPDLGMPNSNLTGPMSLGNGSGTGIGSGRGNGIGPGSGGNMGGGVMHIGGSVRAPVLTYQVDPEFSEEARKAKFSGNVEVYLWVDENGNPSHVKVVRGVGMGLDEKAIEAVRQYKFKPAMQNGKPVKVDLYVDVNFQIF